MCRWSGEHESEYVLKSYRYPKTIPVVLSFALTAVFTSVIVALLNTPNWDKDDTILSSLLLVGIICIWIYTIFVLRKRIEIHRSRKLVVVRNFFYSKHFFTMFPSRYAEIRFDEIVSVSLCPVPRRRGDQFWVVYTTQSKVRFSERIMGVQSLIDELRVIASSNSHGCARQERMDEQFLKWASIAIIGVPLIFVVIALWSFI